jgi:hypothetical protein
MDPAIFDYCRFDYCRFDVVKPIFDQAIQQLMAPASDPAVEGRERERVLIPVFDEAIKQLEKS